MYQNFIELSKDSYIEVTTRLFNGEEQVILALRGTNSDSEPAIASVVMNMSNVEAAIKSLKEAKERTLNKD